MHNRINFTLLKKTCTKKSMKPWLQMWLVSCSKQSLETRTTPHRPSLRDHGNLDSLNQRKHTAKDLGSRRSSKCTAELGPSHGSSFNSCNGLQGKVNSWVSDMVEVQGSSGIILYMICRFLLEGARGWEGGMLWKWNCWCSCFVPFINAGYFFPAQWGCLSNTKESWSSSMSLFVYLSLVRAFWANLSTVSIRLSIYPSIQLTYIHLCPSIFPSIHVSI